MYGKINLYTDGDGTSKEILTAFKMPTEPTQHSFVNSRLFCCSVLAVLQFTHCAANKIMVYRFITE